MCSPAVLLVSCQGAQQVASDRGAARLLLHHRPCLWRQQDGNELQPALAARERSPHDIMCCSALAAQLTATGPRAGG